MTQLQRLVLDFRSGELVMRVLYRSEDGLGRTRRPLGTEYVITVGRPPGTLYASSGQ
jgi:hypothetical protein